MKSILDFEGLCYRKVFLIDKIYFFEGHSIFTYIENRKCKKPYQVARAFWFQACNKGVKKRCLTYHPRKTTT